MITSIPVSQDGKGVQLSSHISGTLQEIRVKHLGMDNVSSGPLSDGPIGLVPARSK